MNKHQKQSLKLIITNLESIVTNIESIWSEENNKYENLTDGLQETPMGIKIDEDRTELEDALSNLEEAKQSIIRIIDNKN